MPYTASGFAACGKLFHTLFGVDYMAAMIVSALVIIGYTIMGGFGAVCTTDLIQSIVMSLALVTVVTYGINSAGGFAAVMDNARSLPGYLSLNNTFDAANNTSNSFSFISIVSTLAWGIGYFGMPHILVRFMAIEDEKTHAFKKNRKCMGCYSYDSWYIYRCCRTCNDKSRFT